MKTVSFSAFLPCLISSLIWSNSVQSAECLGLLGGRGKSTTFEKSVIEFEGDSRVLRPEGKLAYEGIIHSVLNAIGLPHAGRIPVEVKQMPFSKSKFVQLTRKLRLPLPEQVPLPDGAKFTIAHEVGHYFFDYNLARDSAFYRKFLDLVQKQSQLSEELKRKSNSGTAELSLIQETSRVSVEMLAYNEVIKPLHEFMADMIAVATYHDGKGMLKARQFVDLNGSPDILDAHDFTTPYRPPNNQVVADEAHLFYAEIKKIVWQQWLSREEDPASAMNALYRASLKFLAEMEPAMPSKSLGKSGWVQRFSKLIEDEFTGREQE